MASKAGPDETAVDCCPAVESAPTIASQSPCPVGTQDCTNQKSIPSKIKSYPHSFTDISSSVKCAESNSKATDTFNKMKTHFDLVQSRSDLFNAFFANLTSLSLKALGYLLRAKMGYYHALALVETHKSSESASSS